MEESIHLLITSMLTDVDSCAFGGDLDLKGKYGETIQAVGAANFFAGVFQRFEDSTLTNWLLCLTFAWKELSFDEWKQVLYSFSDHIDALYGFMPFATQFLGIDIVRVIAEDPSVNPRVRRYAAHRFPRGGPPPGSAWVREMLHVRGIEVQQLWHRLEAEGAPMKVELS